MFCKVFVNCYTTIGRIHERRIKHISTQLFNYLFSGYSAAPTGNGIALL